MMAGCGWLFFILVSNHYLIRLEAGVEGIYDILTMTFHESDRLLSQQNSTCRSFIFIMPVLGIGMLAQGLAEFGVMFFNRRSRGKEWEMAVASTYTNHIVLVGLGHLGYRVVKILREMGEDVVAVSLSPGSKSGRKRPFDGIRRLSKGMAARECSPGKRRD